MNEAKSQPEVNYGFRDDKVYLGGDGQLVAMSDNPASYKACEGITGYRGSQGFEPPLTSQYFCIKTDQNRYAAIRVLSSDVKAVTVDVVVYDPPFK
jgi:hypothetical protein